MVALQKRKALRNKTLTAAAGDAPRGRGKHRSQPALCEPIDCRESLSAYPGAYQAPRGMRSRRPADAPKPKPRWDVHLPGAGNRGGSLAGALRPLIAGPSGSAVSPRLSGWTARPGICRPSPRPTPGQALHRRPAPQAQIASGLLSRPAPDSLIGVEVRAVSPAEPALVNTGVHQPQLQLRRPEVLPHRLPTVGWRIRRTSKGGTERVGQADSDLGRPQDGIKR